MPADRPDVTSSRLVYENRWMRLREDELIWPDGSPGLYAVVEKAPAAAGSCRKVPSTGPTSATAR
jgi:hypothetical protein